MRAICWHGKGDMRVDTRADPRIEEPRDGVGRVNSTAIRGSDLHLSDFLRRLPPSPASGAAGLRDVGLRRGDARVDLLAAAPASERRGTGPGGAGVAGRGRAYTRRPAHPPAPAE